MDLMQRIDKAYLLVVCGALLATAAEGPAAQTPEISWKERYYNPAPSPDDLVLPMPCGGAMVFRPVATPHGSRSLDDRVIELGDESPDYNFLRGRRHEYVSGPFILGDGRTQGYFLGKYEVAIAQYDAVMSGTCGDQPRRADFIAKSELSWFDAVAFTRTYSEWLMREAREALPNVERVPAFVRLPTEAEWEYAARGGAMVDSARFREPRFPLAGSSVTAFAATGDADSANGRIQPIGTLRPNPLGLHDVYGNVSEVVLDAFQLTRLGRLHGEVGGFVKRGGDSRTAQAHIASGSRQEQPFFDLQTGTVFRDPYLGMRAVLATIAIRSEDTAEHLRSDIASIAESNLTGFVALKEGEALAALDDAANDARYQELAPTLRGIRLSLKEAQAARNSQGERAVQSMLLASAAICSRIIAQQGNARVVDEILSQIKETEAQVAGGSNAELAAIQTEVRSVEQRRDSILEGIEANIALYAWLVETVATDYRIEVIEAQAEVIRQEYEQRRQVDQLACAPRILADIRTRQQRGSIDLEAWNR